MAKVFLESLRMNIKKRIEYKASFIISFISQFFLFFTYYYAIVALFNKFSNIRGYNVYEVLLCFSIIYFGFSFNEMIARGIDKFEDYVIDGSLDRYLLRPSNVLFQVLCADIDLVKLARVGQAVVVMIIALVNIDITWNAFKVVCLLLMVIASVIVFFGIFVLMASYCFITVQGLEVRNVFTDGGKHIAQYPISIYHKTVKFFFTFVIPYGFVNYYPLKYLLGKTNNILYMLSPLVVFIFLIPCLWSFQIGLKHYNSTGS